MRTAALLIASGLMVSSPAGAHPSKRHSALEITSVRLGVRASGRIGVRVAFRHSLRKPTTASVAVGAAPRLVLGYVTEQIVSPLRGSLRDERLLPGMRVRVVLSVCANPPKGTASAAKYACAHRTSVSTRAYIHRRY